MKNIANESIILNDSRMLYIEYNTLNNISWLYIHEWHYMQDGFAVNSIDLKSLTSYVISYSRKSYHLLPKPYSTNCIDYYSTTKCLSQSDCIRKCRIRDSIAKYNSIPYETNVYDWEIDKYSKLNFTEDYIDLDNKCHKICHNMDCKKYFYKPYIASQIPNNISETIIGLDYHQSLKLLIIIGLKLNL